jgi:serine/threonine protein kinase
MDALAKLEAIEKALGDSAEDGEFQELLAAVRGNKATLVEVDLRHKQLVQNQLLAICDALKHNTTVMSLSLTGNVLEKDVVSRLAVLLLENRVISELELDFCELDDDLLRILLAALEVRKAKLSKLALMGNATTAKVEAEARSLLLETGSKRGASSHSLASDPSPTSLRSNPGAKALLEELVRQNALMQEELRQLTSLKEKQGASEKKKVMDQVKKYHKIKVNLGNLQINELTSIGNGMGTAIFSCSVDGWQCCMKEMSLEGVSEAEIKAFDTEVELLEKLPYHPNIARYLFHEKTDNRVRLFMSKYAASLRDVINTRRASVSAGTASYFYPGEIAKWSAQIASGVEFLHKHHVIHRNLKPDVLLCTLDSRGFLAQLSITEFDSAKAISKKKQAKTQIGTPSYMSPEVFCTDGSVPYTNKVDVWGIGMILYELITLMVPYEDEDFSKLNTLIPSGTLPSTDHIATDYASLLQIFKDCTQLDPSKRPEVKRVREQLISLSVEYDSFDVVQ